MPRLPLLRPVLVGAIFGGVFLFALVEQITDRANPQLQPNSERLTRAQVADAIGLISEICGGIDLGAGLQFTEGQIVNANTLVAEVCNQVVSQRGQMLVQPASTLSEET